MNLLLKEIKLFSKQNWWIYIIFIICLFIIYKTGSWNLVEISLIFALHFLWDAFMMMMWDYYANKDYKKWTLSQIWGFTTFFVIWLYAWLSNWKWNYLLPQTVFIWPAIKWYFEEVKNKKSKILDYKIVLFFLINCVICLL